MIALTGRARSTSLTPIAVTVVVIAVAPFMVEGQRLFAVTLGLIYGIACIGIDIFSGYGGQLTFGNFAFIGVGAYTSAILSGQQHWNVWLTLPASVVVCASLGLLLAIPTVKVSDLGSALLTFFFAYLVYEFLNGQTLAQITHSADGLAVAPARIFGQRLSEPRTLFYCCLAALTVVAVISWRYANSRPGVSLRMIKRSPEVAAAFNVNHLRSRRVALTYSAALAVVRDPVRPGIRVLGHRQLRPIASVNLMAMVVLGGMGSVIGPVYGAIFFAVITESTRGTASWAQIVFPVMLLLALILFPEGFYGFGERLVKLVAKWRPRRQPTPKLQAAPGSTPLSEGSALASPPADSPELLNVHGASVRFGGLVALTDVSLSVTSGHVHAVMGPNGAGKSTLINCISGLQPFEGDITLGGTSLRGLRSQAVSRRGLSRTFQAPSLVPDLTVLENVSVGSRDQLSLWTLGGWLPLPTVRTADARAERAAANALDLLEFPSHRRQCLGSELTLAEQKSVDVARAIAGAPRLVLLDEPTAGLDEKDMDVMAAALRAVNASGVTLLVIAHHIGFLRNIAHRLTVLDFGKLLVSDTPDLVLTRPDVIDIYLGAEHV